MRMCGAKMSSISIKITGVDLAKALQRFSRSKATAVSSASALDKPQRRKQVRGKPRQAKSGRRR